MKTFKDFILENKNVYIDDDYDKWNIPKREFEHASKGKYEIIGVTAIADNVANYMYLVKPHPEEMKGLSHLKVGTNEKLYRYITNRIATMDQYRIIKINVKRGVAYFYDEEKDAFETRQTKLSFLRLIKGKF